MHILFFEKHQRACDTIQLRFENKWEAEGEIWKFGESEPPIPLPPAAILPTQAPPPLPQLYDDDWCLPMINLILRSVSSLLSTNVFMKIKNSL